MAFLLSTLVLLVGVQGVSSLWTVNKITAQTGGSVIIPCHYHRLHRDLPKHWCKGKNWITCVRMRPTNKVERTGISFSDSPDELVTTMNMTNLRGSDSNRYWCAVKKGASYFRTSLDLSITEGAPDLSVANNRVSGEEDGDVTVQCLYSDKLRDAEKKWCISGDLRSCQTAQDIEASPGAAVQINDTNDGVYTVTLIGLKRTDAGWHWCMAGEIQAPVYISVDSRQVFTDANTRSSTFTTAPSFSFDPNIHKSSTFVPTNSKLVESTSIQMDKPDQTSTSPKQFHSTKQTSFYSSSTEESTVSKTKKPLTSRSITPFVTPSYKDLISVPSPTYGRRGLIWAIAVVCGAFILFMVPGISWKLWSRHKKTNAREESTQLTADFHVNERVDLLSNESTNN